MLKPYMKETIHGFNTKYQLVSPHQHRQNAAENVIKMFKSHFLSGLATCDKTYPITEWDQLLLRAELTLNLLQNSRLNPKLSSWVYLNGNHDFNSHHLAPPGTRVIIHTKPSNRKSLAFHSQMG